MTTALFVPLLAIACFGSFTWAVRGHFRPEGRMPPGMRLTSILSLVGFTWFGWDIGRNHLQGLGNPIWSDAMACILLINSLALFWWTIRTNARRPLTLAFSRDVPSFLQMKGPYGFVRHPFYLSYLLFWIATAIASMMLLHWVVPIVMALLYREAAKREEAKFAGSPLSIEYAFYRTRTGMLVPRLLGQGA